MMEVVIFNIKGTMYRTKKITKMVAEDIVSGDHLELKKETSNKYDGNAVKVYYDDHWIGYVEQEYSKEVSQILDSNVDYNCEVVSCFADWEFDLTESGKEVEFLNDIILLAEITTK